MGDFIEERGIAFFAHLLGRLHDQFVKGFAEWNPEVGIVAPPRTHSTMRVLHEEGPKSITEIAGLVRQSHPLVITWVRCLRDLNFVHAQDDPKDGRRTVLSLTPAGEAELERQEAAEVATIRAFELLFKEVGLDVLPALWKIEHACRTQQFVDRLRSETAKLRLETTNGRHSGAAVPENRVTN